MSRMDLCPPARLDWQLNLHHCNQGNPNDCHVHVVENQSGVSSGNFVAPDHEYPSHLEIVLTATDSGATTGTDTVDLQPDTVDLTFNTVPQGLDLTVGTKTEAAPFTDTFIIGSVNTVSAITPQSFGGTTYEFASWSDGGAQSHDITAPSVPQAFTATYTPTACGSVGPGG